MHCDLGVEFLDEMFRSRQGTAFNCPRKYYESCSEYRYCWISMIGMCEHDRIYRPSLLE